MEAAGGRSATEVLSQFKRRTMKHLGAFLNDCADYWPDTKKRVQAGFLAVKRIARLWSLGTPMAGAPLEAFLTRTN